MGVVLLSDKPTDDNALPLVPATLISFVFALMDQTRPPPSLNVNPRAFARTFFFNEKVT